MFVASLVLMQFSAVSVPGGSIVVITPLLVQYFAFTDEMISMVITLSLCTEYISTACNVMGSYALALIINSIYYALNKNEAHKKVS